MSDMLQMEHSYPAVHFFLTMMAVVVLTMWHDARKDQP